MHFMFTQRGVYYKKGNDVKEILSGNDVWEMMSGTCRCRALCEDSDGEVRK